MTLQRTDINKPRDVAETDQWQRAVEDIVMKASVREIESAIRLARKLAHQKRSDEEVMVAYFALYGWNAMAMANKERKKLEDGQ